MRQLLPEPLDGIDAYDAARPDEPAAALLRLNFVESLDGAVTDESGRSGGLGGAGDRAMFAALRAWADAVLVGAGTARTEGYGPHRPAPALAERRAADGRPEPAAIVLVTRSLNLDFTSPLFTEARTPTVVLTSESAPAGARKRASEAGRVIVAGEREVDLAAGLDRMRAEGLRSVLCEGGPSLASTVLAAGLVDELCLTVAPAAIGRSGTGFAGTLPARVAGRLTHVCEQDSELYLRYRLRSARTA